MPDRQRGHSPGRVARRLAGPVAAVLWRADRTRAAVWGHWPHGRLRAAVIQRLYERVYDHMNRHDAVPDQLLHDDVVVNQTAETLGVVGEFRGRDAPARVIGEIKHDFAELNWQPQHIVEVPPSTIVARVDVSAVGRSSRIRLTVPLTVVMPISNGRAERVELLYGDLQPRAAVRAVSARPRPS